MLVAVVLIVGACPWLWSWPTVAQAGRLQMRMPLSKSRDMFAPALRMPNGKIHSYSLSQRRLEREALLKKRLGELQAAIAQDQEELWELQKRMESRLPAEEHFCRNLERLQIFLKNWRYVLSLRATERH
jgi:hypothetical protein